MKRGFTLAELLIALVILGVIATFTIPKVLTSQQNGQYSSIAKEAAGAVSQAYTLYKSQNTVGVGNGMMDLTPYLNYVAVVTTGLTDNTQGNTNYDCSLKGCLLLHNGAMFIYAKGEYFGGTATTSAVWFDIDPVAGYSGTTNTGKAVEMFIYYNGKITDRGNILPNTQTNSNTYNPNTGTIPPWFSWS